MRTIAVALAGAALVTLSACARTEGTNAAEYLNEHYDSLVTNAQAADSIANEMLDDDANAIAQDAEGPTGGNGQTPTE